MSRTRCKVDDGVEDYGLQAPGTELDSIHDYLAARWTGAEGYRSVGYRQLADWFNRQLLRRVYDEHGRSTTGTRLDSEYGALTGDDDLVREEVVADLAATGIDAEAVVDDMVSPRTMHRHLTGCLDAEKSPQEAETDWERASVERAREQLEEKVAKAASALASKEALLGADAADIDVRIYLACPECATRVTLETGRRQGYVCEVHSPAPTEASVEGIATPTHEDESVVEAVTRFST